MPASTKFFSIVLLLGGSAVLLLGVSTGCDAGGPGCPHHGLGLPVVLGGDLSARGSLELEPTKGGLRTTLKIIAPTNLAPHAPHEDLLELTGVGACSNHVVRLRLGGGAASRPGLTILGAEVEGIYEPTLDEREFFGAWSADVADARGQRHLRGFIWHETSAAAAAGPQ